MIENQPSNVESKTTVGTAAAAAGAKRNQQVPARQRVYQPQQQKPASSAGAGKNIKRREYASNFDHYDEVKTTGNTLNRHPATAAGGRRPRPALNKINDDNYAVNLTQDQEISQS